MIKNKKIIAVLCAAAVAVGLSVPVAAETTNGGYGYGNSSTGTAVNSDGNTINVSIGNTFGSDEIQKKTYENFANYVDSLVANKTIKNPKDADAIKANAAMIIARGGDPTDDVYGESGVDARLIVKVTSDYNENATYKQIYEEKNSIEETLLKNESGTGLVGSYEISAEIKNVFGVGESTQDQALLDLFLEDQNAETVQKVIDDKSTLNEGTKNKLQEIGETGSSVNGVVYGTETFRDFCAKRGLEYDEAWKYILDIGNNPSNAPSYDKELALQVKNFLEISNGAAHDEIAKNLDKAMKDSNNEIETVKQNFQELFLYDVETKQYIQFVDEVAGSAYRTETEGAAIVGTNDQGRKLQVFSTTTVMQYFNTEKYDPDKLITTLEILFPGYLIEGEYESYIRAGGTPEGPNTYNDFIKLLNEISTDYHGGTNPYDFSLFFKADDPAHSIVFGASTSSGITSELEVTAENKIDIHRTVDTMTFELQRIDGMPIMDEERAYTDAEIFANLYNMYFTPDVRTATGQEASMFTILDTYMQLHAQIYGKVGMPPITTDYQNDTIIYKIDFKSGITKMAADAGISYLDFVRNYFSYYERPTYKEWTLVPSMHTYSFYPQETQTTTIPKLLKEDGVTPYYIGTIHQKTALRGTDPITPYYPNVFSNLGGMLRAIGYKNYGETIDDYYLKTDSVNPVLLTLRPEISSAYNVHVWVDGTAYKDPTHSVMASDGITNSTNVSWVYQPYREIFIPDGGSYTSSASYAEEWGPLSVGDNVFEAQEEQAKLALQNGSAQLVQSIIDENNKQFVNGRGDVASYYNFVIYNGTHTSEMDASIASFPAKWRNKNTRGYNDLTEEEKARMDASNGSLSLADFQYETYSKGGITLQIPKDKNGQPLYNLSYGYKKCAYENGGGDNSAVDKVLNQYATMGQYNDIMNNWSGNPQELANTMNSTFGTNVEVDSSGIVHTADGGMCSVDTYFQDMVLSGELSSSGGSSGEPSGPSGPSEPTGPKKKHGSIDDGLPDQCEYYAECCTRWFTASWNPKATVPYFVMDDVTPLAGDVTALTYQPYEQYRMVYDTYDEPDSVFHWIWSQTLEADPNGTTSLKLTEGTLPTAQDPNVDPTPSIGTRPNNNSDPDETTYRTTGGDLPPMPTPITIPPADDPNKGNIVIEQFISK